jgi:hypothetical protein
VYFRGWPLPSVASRTDLEVFRLLSGGVSRAWRLSA